MGCKSSYLGSTDGGCHDMGFRQPDGTIECGNSSSTASNDEGRPEIEKTFSARFLHKRLPRLPSDLAVQLNNLYIEALDVTYAIHALNNIAFSQSS